MPLQSEQQLEDRRLRLREGLLNMERLTAEMNQLMERVTKPNPLLSKEEQDRERHRLRELNQDIDEHRGRINRLRSELAAEYHIDKPEFIDIFQNIIQTQIDLIEGNFLSVDGLKHAVLNIYDRLDSFAANVSVPTPWDSLATEANRPAPIALPPEWGETFQHPQIGIPIGVPSFLGAYTGGRKTTAALNIVRSVARTDKVLILSLEMTTGQLWASLIGQHIYANGGDRLSRSQILRQVRENSTALKSTVSDLEPNVHVIDTAGQTALNLIQTYDNFCHQNHGPPRLVVLDYLQLIKSLPTYDNRRLMIDETVALLTEKIKRIDSGWLNVVQTNRTSEHAHGGRAPDKSSFKESGSIETDAGFALTLGKVPKRLQRTAANLDDGDLYEDDRIEIRVAKNRFGPEPRAIVEIEPVTGTIGELPKAQMEMAL